MSSEKIIFSMAGVSKIFPPQKKVLKNIYLSFFYGAKIGVLGLNGSGKSSLLKIIAGMDKEFLGEVVWSPNYTVGMLEQEPKLDPTKTVKEVVEEAVHETVALLKEFEAINEKFMDPALMDDPDAMNDLIEKQGVVQEKLDAANAWELDVMLDKAMDALRLPPSDANVANLSGGGKATRCPLQIITSGAGCGCSLTNLPTTSMPNRCIGWSSICKTTKERSSP